MEILQYSWHEPSVLLQADSSTADSLPLEMVVIEIAIQLLAYHV